MISAHFIEGESNTRVIIRTLEGDHAANPHDCIIQGVAGALYPCKPEIFEATCESGNLDGDDTLLIHYTRNWLKASGIRADGGCNPRHVRRDWGCQLAHGGGRDSVAAHVGGGTSRGR